MTTTLIAAANSLPRLAARSAEEHELRPKQPCQRAEQPSLGYLLGYVAATEVPTLIEALQMGLSLYDRYGASTSLPLAVATRLRRRGRSQGSSHDPRGPLN
jgi:hypothetical protein